MAPPRYGKYEVIRTIASGGMARVYLCRMRGEEGFRKRVALKVIHPRHSDDPRFRDLFAREARLAAGLSHPNLVQVFDFGREGEEYFLAMEFVEGWNLAQAAAKARELGLPVPAGVWRHWVEGIGSGLAYLHEKGIVHRDVSPGNVLLGRNGAVKITDFGISRVGGGGPEGAREGKAGYLSPERARGEEATASSDLFAAGVIAAELLLGRRLFQGDRPEETTAKIASFDGAAFPFPQVPPPVASLLGKALAARPADRFPDAAEFLRELAHAVPARATSPALAEYWDTLFPGAWEEETGILPGPEGQLRPPSVVREPNAGYGVLGRGVQAGAAAAFVALVVGGVLVWQKLGGGRPVPSPAPDLTRGTGLPSPAGSGAGERRGPGAEPPNGAPATGIASGAQPAPAPSFPSRPSPPARSPGTVPPSAAPSLPVRRILIETEPSGASVMFEQGPELGVTPLVADSSRLEGKRIVLAMEGYQRVTIPGSALGNRETFRVELEPVTGTLEAIQAIPWAKVYLGNRYLGETPLTAVRLPVGQHRLRFVNEPLGADRVETITIRPGDNPKVIVPLTGKGR